MSATVYHACPASESFAMFAGLADVGAGGVRGRGHAPGRVTDRLGHRGGTRRGGGGPWVPRRGRLVAQPGRPRRGTARGPDVLAAGAPRSRPRAADAVERVGRRLGEGTGGGSVVADVHLAVRVD